ncbi:MAG TPA: Uma2 family endonuclease [Chthoniobacterales bacterium]|nr:Uma2 family endonuclease [Chthoniobacterales bacterium]
MDAAVQTYRFSVEEFNKLGEVGIFDEDDRVELLDGEIIVMSPIGRAHAGIVLRLNTVLNQRLHTRALVNPANPAVLDEYSEPLPDFTLLKPKADFYKSGHPRPEDILLLIEVSDTTLAYDRGRKLRKYAEREVREVWIVNVKDLVIEQFRVPAGQTYSSSRVFRRGEQITMEAFPDVVFEVSELIG